MEKKKRGLLHAVICVGLVCLIWGGYFFVAKWLRRENNIKHLVKDDYSFMFQIDDVREDTDFVTMEGWVFKLGVDAKKGDMEIWLLDTEENELIYPKIKNVIREDVNNHFLCEYDYSESGVIAEFDKKELSLQKSYEIVIYDRKGDKVYRTETYLDDGKILYCSPDSYKPLDVKGTDLEKIVSDGVLRVYRPDVGMYVYQYDEELYWIADESFEFEYDNGNLEYTIYTTQPWNLVVDGEERSAVDMKFYFEIDEIHGMNTGKYRVCSKKISREYPTYKVITGIWTMEDEWYWRNEFRIFITK